MHIFSDDLHVSGFWLRLAPGSDAIRDTVRLYRWSIIESAVDARRPGSENFFSKELVLFYNLNPYILLHIANAAGNQMR